MPRLCRDAAGTPGILAASPLEAYHGLGFLHGRYRGLQALLITAAGRGVLAATLLPRADLLRLDVLARRLDLPGRGRAEADRVPEPAASFLDAYLAGLHRGLAEAGTPLELRPLFAHLPLPDRASILAALLLSAYLGLAEGQERMEHALIEALAAGANPALLERMFHPHLAGWDPRRLARLGAASPAASGRVGSLGGSNAWAVGGERAAGGKPILAGDPHLQINQLPAVFFEIRARVGDGYWLGATIPGLPGIAVGRNRHVAWSGTFACADNVDWFVEEASDAGGPGHPEVVVREVEIGRRFRRPLKLSFFDTGRGTLVGPPDEGARLASRWAGLDRAALSLAAHLELPLATSVTDAGRILQRAQAHSLHFVLADTGGDICYQQLGRVPRRSAGWSGLYPGDAGQHWRGFYEGESLPQATSRSGAIVSANEARITTDGAALATLAQPSYRSDRITAMLAAQSHHDRRTMAEIQLDLVSLQAVALRPRLLPLLPPGALCRALTSWDCRYDVDSVGAHAFEIVYGALLSALGAELGGDWLRAKLDQSELGVWWLSAFDRVLNDDATWLGMRGRSLFRALAAVSARTPRPWGEVQELTHRNLVLGGLPRYFGMDRGPYPLPGSKATVRQGNVLTVDGGTIAVGPSYRMIADLSADDLWTALPGGIDGDPRAASYACWLPAWHRGDYHRVAPPELDEPELDPFAPLGG